MNSGMSFALKVRVAELKNSYIEHVHVHVANIISCNIEVQVTLGLPLPSSGPLIY